MVVEVEAALTPVTEQAYCTWFTEMLNTLWHWRLKASDNLGVSTSFASFASFPFPLGSLHLSLSMLIYILELKAERNF